MQELYARLRTLPEDSVNYAIAERAIGLALSPRRGASNTAFLRHDAWRDAKRSVRRSRVRQERLLQRLENLALVGGRTAALPGLVDWVTPESVYAARELEALIRTAINSEHALGGACLTGLLAGEAEQETAERLGVSRSTVSRLRRRIREITAVLVADSVDG